MCTGCERVVPETMPIWKTRAGTSSAFAAAAARLIRRATRNSQRAVIRSPYRDHPSCIMDELGEEVEIERGVAASLPSNGAETAHLATWVAAKDRSPPYSAGPGCLGE